MSFNLKLENLLPPHRPIKITNGVDRYGFSSILARRLNMRSAPRSFANWVHGWCWWDEHTAELLSCHMLPKYTSIIVTNEIEKDVLISEGFENVRSGGLPFAYVSKQHNCRNNDALLAFPPHTAEVEKFTTNHKDYFDYLESIKKDFDDVYVSIYHLDINSPMHHAALERGLKVVHGANPSDANGLVRVRCILDSFKYVTSNTIGSHMLYALYAGCNFSFSGPFYAYDESVFNANGNLHMHSKQYINQMVLFSSKGYVKERFPYFFVEDPSMGIQSIELGVKSIGEKFMLEPQEIKEALGWSFSGQLDGYRKGALRRISSSFKL